MALQPSLVASDPGLDLVKGGAERRMSLRRKGVARKGMARGKLHRAVHAKGVALAADHHVRGTAAVEDLADRGVDFIDDPLAQGRSDIDMLAGDLDFHGVMGALSPPRSQSPDQPAVASLRRRSVDEGILMDSRYLATVRRAISTPEPLRISTIRSSE